MTDSEALAINLSRLAKGYQSQDPAQCTLIRQAFKKHASFNDCTRTLVYLLEVVGSRDMEFKNLQQENKDLREILKLNNIVLDGEETGSAVPENINKGDSADAVPSEGEKTDGATQADQNQA